MRHAWITGNRGFAGRHLAAELAGRDVRVTGIDRPGSPPAEGQLALDLSDEAEVAAALREDAPDTIFHLAAQSSGGASFADPGHTLRNNLGTTLGLLQGIRGRADDGAEPPFLLSVGSCEEYGPPADDSELPLREEQPLRPNNPYAVSKAAQTLLCMQYRGSFGLPVLSARSFTHTGPGQDPRFVFSSWARQIALAERAGDGPMQLKVGDTSVSRDVSDVREIVKAYADLAQARCDLPVVNICSGREYPLREGLQRLVDAARLEVEVVVDQARLRPSDVPRFVGDPSRLREQLGWVPQRPVGETLDELLEDWRDRLAQAATN